MTNDMTEEEEEEEEKKTRRQENKKITHVASVEIVLTAAVNCQNGWMAAKKKNVGRWTPFCRS